jgi:hypothetical protein
MLHTRGIHGVENIMDTLFLNISQALMAECQINCAVPSFFKKNRLAPHKILYLLYLGTIQTTPRETIKTIEKTIT